jgi:hypothetical protein
MKINVKNHNLIVEGEKVKSIEFLYDDLLRKGPIKKNKPEKTPLIIYHLEGGGMMEFEADLMIEI